MVQMRQTCVAHFTIKLKLNRKKHAGMNNLFIYQMLQI